MKAGLCLLHAGLGLGCAIVAGSAVACDAANGVAAQAMQLRASLAGYYAHHLAIVDGQVWQWRSGERPHRVLTGARHVSVGRAFGYAIDEQHRALYWPLAGAAPQPLLEQVALLSAGESAVFAIRCDGSLWERHPEGGAWQRSADVAVHAWVGDSADYYIDADGTLYARGLAHRGQYGDGRLVAGPGWTAVAAHVRQVVAHTGHAVHLRQDGDVLGTGGNRHGPLGLHGHGDKAARWGVLFAGARAIATGSRHTAALAADGGLWVWGGDEGLAPRRVALDAVEIAAGFDTHLARDRQGRIWHWPLAGTPALLPTPRQRAHANRGQDPTNSGKP